MHVTKNCLSECTTIIVGEKASADGSRILARSEDFDAFECKNWQIFEATEKGPSEFVAIDTNFKCPLPPKALGYSSLPDFAHKNEWGSAGFNSEGIGESSTETIFSNEKVLKIDPYVENGLTEECTFNIILPYIHSAREGVERLGKLIEEYGSGEGFGIGFIDNKETWYLENAGGHRWLACRIPSEEYFVSGNQSRFRKYDPNDKENFLASSDLIEFAHTNGLYDPSLGEFDFHEAYSKDDIADHTYNYPRVWGLQQLLSPSILNDVNTNSFPVFAKADKKISIKDLRQAFRFHYDNTSHDPYLNNNGKEPYRPVSIFRTCQTHLLQVRPWLPKEIGCINYVANGMADLGVFLPLYQGISSYPKAYTIGDNIPSQDSAYWKFRKVMTLGMVNYNAYAPIIKKKYSELEEDIDRKQKEMEDKFIKIYEKNPSEAKEMLQKFSDSILTHALEVADELQNELFSQLTSDIQKEYLFHGA